MPGSPLDDGSIFADSLVTPREHGHASLLPDSLSRSPSLGPDCVSRRLGVGESAKREPNLYCQANVNVGHQVLQTSGQSGRDAGLIGSAGGFPVCNGGHHPGAEGGPEQCQGQDLVTLPGAASDGGGASQVMLFDKGGSTYICILGESNGGALEYIRAGGESWCKVERSDRSRAAQYTEAGVPKSVPWSGPTIVVYTTGKLDCKSEGMSSKPTRKYYQWCGVCCKAGCGNTYEGCNKAKCWVAPRKWKKHVESQAHMIALRINHRIEFERNRQGTWRQEEVGGGIDNEGAQEDQEGQDGCGDETFREAVAEVKGSGILSSLLSESRGATQSSDDKVRLLKQEQLELQQKVVDL